MVISVTRWLDNVFSFGHLQQRNFAELDNFLPIKVHNYAQNKTSPEQVANVF